MMRIKRSLAIRTTLLISLMVSVTGLSTRLQADTGSCGTGPMTSVPFIDVMGNPFFCQIAEAYFSGLANGTDATHYSPAANVSREQVTAFATRSMDQSLMRGHNRAALNQFWTNKGGTSLVGPTITGGPTMVKSDGADLWVSSSGAATVTRVRGSDGALLNTWTGMTGAFGVLVASGKVFVSGTGSPGHLYQIDPTLPPPMGGVPSIATVGNALGIAFDGQRVWTANQGTGSVSIVTLPSTVSTVTTGFTNLSGIVFDGTNMWVTDNVGSVDKLHRLNSMGAISMFSVDVGDDPRFPVFDGTNIWVPNNLSNNVTVVRAIGPLAGMVLATLSGNGLNGPWAAAFDGERIMVTNTSGSTVSLWKASDLTPLSPPGGISTGMSSTPQGVCSDGLNFWITLFGPTKLVRF